MPSRFPGTFSLLNKLRVRFLFILVIRVDFFVQIGVSEVTFQYLLRQCEFELKFRQRVDSD